MSKRTEYLLEAEFCQTMAVRVSTPEKKATWQALATNWVLLADMQLEAEDRQAPASEARDI